MLDEALRKRLEKFQEEYDGLISQLGDPSVMRDGKSCKRIAARRSELQGPVEKFAEYARLENELAAAKELYDSDEEIRDLAKEEVEKLESRLEELTGDLRERTAPKDPDSGRNTIVEIRAGAGGDEAGLFAGDLFRMYYHYAENRGWKVEVLNSHATSIGGVKEIIFLIQGEGAYGQLKYEKGVHRVQRIPATEAGGRIHTSTVTVAVLPEAEDVDVDVAPNDLRIDVYRASGPGGQGVNTTDSAVRITHIPTGLVVSCQDERSQLKNKGRAMKVLRSRLLEQARREQKTEIATDRKKQVGTGDRSERIRTYNFPQNRVTDHRIGLTIYKLGSILEGELETLIQALRDAEAAGEDLAA